MAQASTRATPGLGHARLIVFAVDDPFGMLATEHPVRSSRPQFQDPLVTHHALLPHHGRASLQRLSNTTSNRAINEARTQTTSQARKENDASSHTFAPKKDRIPLKRGQQKLAKARNNGLNTGKDKKTGVDEEHLPVTGWD